jgi:hypothetical protein
MIVVNAQNQIETSFDSVHEKRNFHEMRDVTLTKQLVGTPNRI